MRTSSILAGLLFIFSASALALGERLVDAANVGVTGSNFTFQDGDGDSDTTIDQGDTVTWTFADAEPHTVTSDTGAFSSGAQQVGGTYAFTFNTPGTYAYHCEVHGAPGAGMHGTIIVQAVATNTPQPTNTAVAGATNTPTRTATKTATPQATSTGTVTVVPTMTVAAATPTPVVVAPVTTQVAGESARPQNAPGRALIGPSVGTGDASSSGVNVDTIAVVLALTGLTMIGGAAVAKRG
jgi:plastocyanin